MFTKSKQIFSEINIIDDSLKKYFGKILEHYIARCCSNARSRKLIKYNHYLNEYYSVSNSKYGNVVFSPSKVPISIAVKSNIRNIENSSVAYIIKDHIKSVHPSEYILPTLMALPSQISVDNFFRTFIFSTSLANILIDLNKDTKNATFCSLILGLSLVFYKTEEEHRKGVQLARYLLEDKSKQIDIEMVLDEFFMIDVYNHHDLNSNTAEISEFERLIESCLDKISADLKRMLDLAHIYYCPYNPSSGGTLFNISDPFSASPHPEEAMYHIKDEPRHKTNLQLINEYLGGHFSGFFKGTFKMTDLPEVFHLIYEYPALD